MSNDIPSLVESVRRLDKEATKGPWKAQKSHHGIYDCPDVADAHGDCIAAMDSRGALAGPAEITANIEFIVLSRTAAPILATEVTRLQKELETERRKVEVARGLIENAPHAFRCHATETCDCWKRDALAALTPSERTPFTAQIIAQQMADSVNEAVKKGEL